MRAYSIDMRERILQAVEQGYPREEIMKLFGISRSAIKRYLKQWHETGNISARPIPGRLSKKFAPLQAGLTPQLQAHPDVTLEVHCQLWEQEHGQRVSTTTMGRAIRRMGWTRKKRRWVPPNATTRHGQPGETTASSSMPANWS